MIKIRKASSKDFKRISEIYKEVFSEFPYNESWSEKDALKKIKESFDKCKVFIAVIEKEVIGFVIYHDFLMYDGVVRFVDDFGVDKKYRRRGVGNALMDAIEKDNKIVRLWLLARPNSKAFIFYKNRNYHESGWINMEKRLK